MKTPEMKPTPRPLGGTYGAGEALRARQKKLARKGRPRKNDPGAPQVNAVICPHAIRAGEFCVHCERICSICQGTYTGWGNHAWPVNEGRCCSTCNSAVVIVARLNQLHQHAKKAKESP